MAYTFKRVHARGDLLDDFLRRFTIDDKHDSNNSRRSLRR